MIFEVISFISVSFGITRSASIYNKIRKQMFEYDKLECNSEPQYNKMSITKVKNTKTMCGFFKIFIWKTGLLGNYYSEYKNEPIGLDCGRVDILPNLDMNNVICTSTTINVTSLCKNSFMNTLKMYGLSTDLSDEAVYKGEFHRLCYQYDNVYLYGYRYNEGTKFVCKFMAKNYYDLKVKIYEYIHKDLWYARFYLGMTLLIFAKLLN